MTSVNNTPTGQIVVKSKVVQITLVAVVAITLMTTGIVYANDDIMTEIENAIKSLQQADKQQDKQIKKLNKQIKELQQQNEELQQENENQTKKIKRLKEFRDNANANFDYLFEKLHTFEYTYSTHTHGHTQTDQTEIQSETQTDQTEMQSDSVIITLNKTTLMRGDDLEFVVNIESIPSTIIVNATINDTKQETNATLNSLYLGTQNIEGTGVGGYCSINNSAIQECSFFDNVDGKFINQTAFTYKLTIPYNFEIGSHEHYVEFYPYYMAKEYGVKKNGDNWEIFTDYYDDSKSYSIFTKYNVIP